MIKSIKSILISVFFMLMLSLTASAVVINEVRTDEPGDDVNEYVELKGTPGESLDDLWYIVIGDHSNHGNPDENAPWYGAGGVEFAFELTGFVIEPDGYFLLVESDNYNLTDFSEVSFDVADLIFENNENVTHLLVSNYTGVTVEKDSDQWGDKSIDIDDDNDGIVNDVLPWTAIIDGVSFLSTPNDELPEGDEPDYGPSLGVPSVGPDGGVGSVPKHIFRDRIDGTWKIGSFSMVGGVNLDTPGTENSSKPFVNSYTPTIASPGSTVTIYGTNFEGAESVKIAGTSVEFTVVSNTEITAILPQDAVDGPIVVTTPNGVAQSSTDIKILEIVFLEDFEVGLGDFLVISVAGERDWYFGTFSGNGFAQMGGFDFSEIDQGPSDDWLISGEIDLQSVTNANLNVTTARAYGAEGPELEILVSTTYVPGVPDLADWIPVTGTLSDGNPNYEIQESGDIDLSAFEGEVIRIAFRYTSPTSFSEDAPTWQVHEAYITGTSVVMGDLTDDMLGLQYHYSEDWAYNYTMGLLYVSEKPWVYSDKYGWIYLYPGSVTTGAWGFFAMPTESSPDYAWIYEDFFGWLQFESDGRWENFHNP